MKNKLSESAQVFYNSVDRTSSLQKLSALRLEVENHGWISRSDKITLFKAISDKVRLLKKVEANPRSFERPVKRRRFACV